MVELWALLSPRVRHRSSARSNCHRQCSSQERHWCLGKALMLTCQNLPLWHRCERCNNVCLRLGCHGWINWTACRHVTCALIEMSRKLATSNYTSSLALWTTLEYDMVDANGVGQGIQKVRLEPASRSVVATWIIIEKKGYENGRVQEVNFNKQTIVLDKTQTCTYQWISTYKQGGLIMHNYSIIQWNFTKLVYMYMYQQAMWVCKWQACSIWLFYNFPNVNATAI